MSIELVIECRWVVRACHGGVEACHRLLGVLVRASRETWGDVIRCILKYMRLSELSQCPGDGACVTDVTYRVRDGPDVAADAGRMRLLVPL